MPPRVYPLVSVLAALAWSFGAGADPLGFPLIQSLDLSSISRSNQTFCVAQGADGLMVVGGLAGLLIYDGARWETTSLSSGSAVFAVAGQEDGTMGAGGVEDFGLLESSPEGLKVYRSLVSELPPEEREVGDIRTVLATAQNLLFVGDRRLFLWRQGKLRAVTPPPGQVSRPSAFRLGDRLFIGLEQGLFELVDERLEPVPGGELVAGQRIQALLPGAEGLLLALEEQGLFLLRAGRLEPFAPQASAWAVEMGVTASVQLPDGRLVLGSQRGGLLLFDAAGTVQQRIDSTMGLPDDVVSALAVDREGGLLVALTNGLARLEVNSPLSVLDQRSGLRGKPIDVVTHQGRLWVATSAGLFASRPGPGPITLEPTRQLEAAAWSLLPLGEQLAVGTSNGVLLLSSAGWRRLEGSEGRVAYLLKASGQWPDRVWVGLREGLGLLVFKNGEWRWGGTVPGVPRYVRAVVERKGVVWAACTFDGLVKLEIQGADPLATPPRVTLTSGTDDIHFDAVPTEVAGRVLAARDNGIYELDEELGKLVPAKEFTDVTGFGFAFLLAEDGRGRIWINSDSPRVLLSPWEPKQRQIRWLAQFPARDIQGFVPAGAGGMWLMTEIGLVHHNGNLTPGERPPPAPRVRRASLAGKLLALSTASLPPSARRLRIEFAPLSFERGLSYQTRLEPLDEEWSPAITEPAIELARLPAGSYTLRVRSLAADRRESRESTWTFAVRSPWYSTAWALALWILVGLAAVRAWVVLRSRALTQRAARLEAQVAVKTEELRQVISQLSTAQAEVEEKNRQLEALSLADPLTGLANRRRFDAALAEEWSRGERHRLPVALVLLDLDHFKHLNDSRGHLEGDAALRQVAEVIAHQARRVGDVAARYGGEELALLLPGTSGQGALELAERVRLEIEALAIPRASEGRDPLTASLGVAAAVPEPGQSPETLVAAADAALYRSKAAGRNRVEG